MENMTKPHWYVGYTYPNFEKKVFQELTSRQVDAFLPLRTIIRQWSDRKKKVEVPLFPNYIFIYSNQYERLKFLNINGMVKYISFDGRPATVPSSDINIIKKLVSGNYNLGIEESGEVGGFVRITKGPLEGLEGEMVEKKNKSKLIIRLSFTSKVVCVEVPQECTIKLNGNQVLI